VQCDVDDAVAAAAKPVAITAHADTVARRGRVLKHV
jgi:hypothetical protein